jgi:DUF971 family protein
MGMLAAIRWIFCGGNAPALDIKQAQVVGRYALNFQWSDGHAEGIYTFDFLRQLCQCESCVDKKNE